ncbi:MAG: pyridoxal phosphate-dependent aminotransferase [Armatimonadota bacterium]
MVIERSHSLLRESVSSVHGGLDARELAQFGLSPDEVIDFSANQSPLGPSPRVAASIARAEIEHYPDRDALPLASAIARHHGLLPEQVVVGNGSTELIRLLAQLALQPGEETLELSSTFGEYAVATRLAGGIPRQFEIQPEATFTGDDLRRFLRAQRPRICWLCSPNNPTGHALPPDEIAAAVHSVPETLFVLDEAYCDLLPVPQWSPELLAGGNLLVVRSMTKAWGLAGLRLGYTLGSAEGMRILRTAKPPWNVNACAQEAGIAALSDSAHYANTISLLREQKAAVTHALQEMGWRVLPSAAAFFLVKVGDAGRTRRHLLSRGCLVRDCASFGLPEYIRISPRLPEQNACLLSAFATLAEIGGTQ